MGYHVNRFFITQESFPVRWGCFMNEYVKAGQWKLCDGELYIVTSSLVIE